MSIPVIRINEMIIVEEVVSLKLICTFRRSSSRHVVTRKHYSGFPFEVTDCTQTGWDRLYLDSCS